MPVPTLQMYRRVTTNVKVVLSAVLRGIHAFGDGTTFLLVSGYRRWKLRTAFTLLGLRDHHR
jgi:hypothetical protein